MRFNDYWRAMNGMSFEKSKLTKTEIEDVQNTIAEMQEKGISSSAIITALQEQNTKLAQRWKAERAYWTEVKRQDTTTIGDVGDDVGFTSYKTVLSPHACKVCRAKSENGNKIFKQSDIEKSGWGHVPPFHPNAIVGSTHIMAPNIESIIRAKYSGDIVKITFADGGTLSVTEHHMVLTRRGFVAAHLLRKGDDVVSDNFLKGIRNSDPNDNNSVPTIEQVFDAAIKTRGVITTSVPVSPEYLHGDARLCDGNIDVVPTNSLLWDASKSTLRKHVHEFLFSGVWSAPLFDSLRNLGSVLVALALSTDGIMRGGSVAPVLGFSPLTVHQLEGLLDSANYNTRVQKSLSDDISGNTESVSDAVLALSANVGFDNIVDIQFDSHDGYVYDVSTSSTLYTCNGYITSNCYCVLIPVE